MVNPKEEGIVNRIIGLIELGRIALAHEEIKNNIKGFFKRNKVLSLSTAEVLAFFLKEVSSGNREKAL
ncbi:hypothetical protein HYX07_02290 [Candidatus Woesearchaeota archaeon]|nr:hypothetical protein [Candidatus Woesearchaeota archaeon]